MAVWTALSKVWAKGKGFIASGPSDGNMVPLTYVFAHSGIAASHTGDTAEAVLATITFPANSIGPNGVIVVDVFWSVTNSANLKTGRVRLGGIGGTIYLSVPVTASTHMIQRFRIANRNSAASQIGGALSGGTGTGSTLATSALDTTASVDLVFTGQCANAADTITLEEYTVSLVYMP